jgi:23S rRNA (uracil1939-C5)-methyltransferase
MIGKVIAIAKGGCGIVRDAGKTIFVPGVLAGEKVEYSLRGRQKSVWRGELLQVLEASPQRTRPACPHYGDCGGCNLQHMSYKEQLRSKKEILLNNMKRIAGVDLEPGFAVLASPPERYRSKGEFQVRGGRAGFFARDSHQVVAISGCRLLPEAAESFFLARRPDLAAYGNAQLQVISNGRELAARLQADSGQETWFSREQTVRFDVGPYAYRFAPDNFVQANLFQLRPMLRLLEEALEGAAGAVAADLFCGGGFFTLILASRFREVLALENDPANIAALRANLELNRAGNVSVVEADVLRTGPPVADLYVVDPPRGGLSARVIAAMAGGGAGTVIYYSCDSATFSRDLRLFIRHGYRQDDLRLIDNFPQSDHFEICSVLKKNKKLRRPSDPPLDPPLS